MQQRSAPQRSAQNNQYQYPQHTETTPLVSERLPINLDGKDNPTFFMCKYCKKANVSEMTSAPTTITWIFSAILAPCCCCCLPLFVKNCNSLHHYCSVCGRQVGFKKLDTFEDVIGE